MREHQVRYRHKFNNRFDFYMTDQAVMVELISHLRSKWKADPFFILDDSDCDGYIIDNECEVKRKDKQKFHLHCDIVTDEQLLACDIGAINDIARKDKSVTAYWTYDLSGVEITMRRILGLDFID